MSLNQLPFLQMTTPRQTTPQNIFRQRLRSIAVDSGLSSGWPGPAIVEQPSQSAGGLFIWASTAVGFIEDDGWLPHLNMSTQGESPVKLHQLYQLTLVKQFKSFHDDELEILRQVLGSIVVPVSI